MTWLYLLPQALTPAARKACSAYRSAAATDDEGWRRDLGYRPDAQPAVRRDADGLACRVDRLRLCGNGVVPLVAAHAWRTLKARFDGDA